MPDVTPVAELTVLLPSAKALLFKRRAKFYVSNIVGWSAPV